MATRTCLATSTLVMMLAAMPEAAAAATVMLNGGSIINVPPTQSYSLGRQVMGAGNFSDLYEFELGASVTLASSGFQSTRLGDASNLDFTEAVLYSGFGIAGPVVATYNHGAEGADGQETESLGATLLNPGRYTILLSGNVTADSPVYNGNVTFAAAAAAVPEPAAWSLMLIGFAGIGAALRAGRQKVSFSKHQNVTNY